MDKELEAKIRKAALDIEDLLETQLGQDVPARMTTLSLLVSAYASAVPSEFRGLFVDLFIRSIQKGLKVADEAMETKREGAVL